MAVEKYITASCMISKNSVSKNGKLIFENRYSELQHYFTALYMHLSIDYPKFYKMDNLCKLGWLASEILLKDEYTGINYQPEDTGIVVSNAGSSLDTDLKYLASIKDMPSPALFVYTLPNILIGEICIRNNFKGENAFFILKEFDSEFICQYVSNLLDNNYLQAGICGWVELVEEEYKAVLYLVEKQKRAGSILFTKEHMKHIFTEPAIV